jgi:lincosamide nucleotidyltransferase A/C/D/E
MMSAADVLSVLDFLNGAGIRNWADGGWGVDALLCRQTRQHDDLDLAIPLPDVEKVRGVLASAAYLERVNELPTRLELRDLNDRRIDLHPLSLDAQGDGIQVLQNGEYGIYTAEGLTGNGQIGGKPVSCLSATLQLKFHTGYDPDNIDRLDVELLCRTFGLEMPPEYK